MSSASNKSAPSPAELLTSLARFEFHVSDGEGGSIGGSVWIGAYFNLLYGVQPGIDHIEAAAYAPLDDVDGTPLTFDDAFHYVDEWLHQNRREVIQNPIWKTLAQKANIR